MKSLKTQFRKNGLHSTLLKRADRIALFHLGLSSYQDCYEVCRYRIFVHIKRATRTPICLVKCLLDNE